MAWRAFVRLPRCSVFTYSAPAVSSLAESEPTRWLATGTCGLVGGGLLFSQADVMGQPTHTEGRALRPVLVDPALVNSSKLPPPMRASSVFESAESGWSLLSHEYRRNVFFVYEKRLREHSPPEKVFEYFSSVKDRSGTFMTRLDLMRAAVPVFQPVNSAHIRSGSLGGEAKDDDDENKENLTNSNFFALFDTDGDGLISFPEYVFFITLLSLSDEQIVDTFKTFDVDNSGCLDRAEFLAMMKEMRQSSSRAGSAIGYRTGLKTTNVDGDLANAGLVHHLFRNDNDRSSYTRRRRGQNSLTLKKFKSFLHELRTEISLLEFTHYDFNNDGSIGATDFAHSIVAGASVRKLQHFIDRSALLAKVPDFEEKFGKRITKAQYMAFCQLLKHGNSMFIEKIKKTAKKKGVRLDRARFLKLVKECGAKLSETQVDVIFFIFDVDGDGELSPIEFLDVVCRNVE